MSIDVYVFAKKTFYIIFLKTEKDIEKFTIFHCLRYSAGALGKV